MIKFEQYDITKLINNENSLRKFIRILNFNKKLKYSEFDLEDLYLSIDILESKSPNQYKEKLLKIILNSDSWNKHLNFNDKSNFFENLENYYLYTNNQSLEEQSFTNVISQIKADFENKFSMDENIPTKFSQEIKDMKKLSNKFSQQFNKSFAKSGIKAEVVNSTDFNNLIKFLVFDFGIFRERRSNTEFNNFFENSHSNFTFQNIINNNNAKIINDEFYEELNSFNPKKFDFQFSSLDILSIVNYYSNLSKNNIPVIILKNNSGDTLGMIIIKKNLIDTLLIREKYQGLGIAKETINIIKDLMVNFTVHSDYKCNFDFYYHQGGVGTWYDYGKRVEFEF